MTMRTLLFSCVAIALAAGAANARSYIEIPVSSPTNRLYLSSMSTRPWWNKAWTRRAPLLVSSTSGTADKHAVIDVVVDPGEKVNPKEVRLVTPWETEVPVVCEAREGTKIALTFETPLRILENRPFLIYWGNPAAEAPRIRSDLRLEADEDEVRLSNGILEVVFDNRHKTPGFIKKFRLIASDAPNQLLERATGYAWSGFSMHFGRGAEEWSSAEVVADNALKKTIRFVGKSADLDFTLYAGEPRLDYAYRIKGEGDCTCYIHLSWACGGGVAYDDLVYPSVTGEMKSVRAALDGVTDSIPNPFWKLTQWLSEGWCAIRDRHSKDTVGNVFDRDSLLGLDEWGHGQAGGEPFNMTFRHEPPKGVRDALTGSGALVATQRGPEAVREEWRRLRAKPVVVLGAAQGYREYPVKIARLDHDYCADFNLGKGAGAGWKTGEPLDGTDWARNLALHLRSYGATVARFGGWNWTDLPLDKALYDRVAAMKAKANPGWKIPEWGEGKFSGAKFKEMTDAAHACGLAVNIWGGFCNERDRYSAEAWALDGDLQTLYPKVGVDGVYNAGAQGEGPRLPPDLANRGRRYWEWKENRQDFFDCQDRITAFVKEFYSRAKKEYPNVPVVMWNSENGELGREMLMSEQAGYFDTCMVEIIPHGDMNHVKHVAKRMRALFDNEDGRTVHHHYFFFHPDCDRRISEVELPFVCGVNGFSHENLTYENFDRELSEIVADFHRFAGYTRLGEKVSKMGPVKNLAVLRDSAAFRNDILTGKTGSPFPYNSQQDGRGKAFGRIRNYNFDIVIDHFFNSKSLGRYNVVFVPEDEVFSDALATELLAFVEAGGGAIVEGLTTKNKKLAALGLKDREVRELGKGKIIWFEKPITDKLGWPEQTAELKKTVVAVGGKEPYEVTGEKSLDSMLQKSADGYYLGVYNTSTEKSDTGTVKLHVPLPENAYVLDVKRGLKTPLVDGTFAIEAGPHDTGHYLIGSDEFTAIPEATVGEWTGASAVATFPKGAPIARSEDVNFRPARAFEFAAAPGGNPVEVRRSQNAAIDITCVCKSEEKLMAELKKDDLAAWQAAHPAAHPYDPAFCRKAIKKCDYVHIRAQADENDALFADCAEELKALLERGGAILFDKVGTGPAARKFLKDAGVFDPTVTAKKCPVDSWGDCTAPTNHLLHISKIGTKHSGRSQPRLVYCEWDKEKQDAPVTIIKDRNYAILVVQENVYGKGKVAFSENFLGFTDWYEQVEYGDALLSWFIGMPVKEHVKKVEILRGGPGAPFGNGK